MNMQHERGHVALTWTYSVGMQHGKAVLTISVDMQQKCSKDIQNDIHPGQAANTCSMDIQFGHAGWRHGTCQY
jgi:hypothetical protein